MNNNVEYGAQKELEEILQDLVLYCASNSLDPVEIKIKGISNSLLYRLTKKYTPIERDTADYSKIWGNIKQLNFAGGSVEFI